MEYIYRIYEEVYNDMLSGKKKVEFRLLNEKSEKIIIGDRIKFIVINNEDKYLLTRVVDKFIYDDLEELWNHKDVLNNSLNYNKEEFIKAFSDIFEEDKVKNSKIVGFKIEKINSNS